MCSCRVFKNGFYVSLLWAFSRLFKESEETGAPYFFLFLCGFLIFPPSFLKVIDSLTTVTTRISYEYYLKKIPFYISIYLLSVIDQTCHNLTENPFAIMKLKTPVILIFYRTTRIISVIPDRSNHETEGPKSSMRSGEN